MCQQYIIFPEKIGKKLLFLFFVLVFLVVIRQCTMYAWTFLPDWAGTCPALEWYYTSAAEC